MPVPTFATLAEQIGKTRERMRKSMRELEEACARLGKPVQIGIAEQLLPLVLKTQDILHDPTLYDFASSREAVSQTTPIGDGLTSPNKQNHNNM